MRNIFLLIAVAAFTSASAQENELFDIGKHLQKKQAEKLKKIEQKVSVFPLPKINRINNLTPPLPPHTKAETLPNGDRVIRNPAYNMPVIVTDIKRFRVMPNPAEDYFAKNFYVPGQPKFNDIPNGAIPDKVFELLREKTK